MHPEGIWIIQLSYLPLMLKTNEVGNICHEHLEYYSLQSLEYLLHLYDLEIVDMELNNINGGSIRSISAIFTRIRMLLVMRPTVDWQASGLRHSDNMSPR